MAKIARFECRRNNIGLKIGYSRLLRGYISICRGLSSDLYIMYDGRDSVMSTVRKGFGAG